MASLGSAFVDVHANTDPFARELRRAINRLSTDLRQDIDKAGSDIGERLGRNVGAQLSETLSSQLKDAKLDVKLNLSQASVAKVEAGLRAVTRDREVDIEVNRRGGFTRGLQQAGIGLGRFVANTTAILGDFFNFGRAIGQIFTRSFDEFSSAVGTAGKSTVTLGTAVINLVSAMLALAAVITILIGLFGVILALVSALYQSLLLILVLIPGLGAVALAAFGPLILIFTNLGDAIKATTGTAEEFGEAIEGFGDNTGAVLGNLRELVQFFLSIREEMQEAFFEPINQAIKELDNNLGPTFAEGFERVAGAAGRFAAGFIELFDHPEAARFFEDLFELGELAFDEIGGAVLDLFAAFTNLADATLPRVEDIILSIADTLEGWADSLERFVESDEFDEKLEEWEESFQTIADLTQQIFDTIMALVEGFRDDGMPVLETAKGIFEDIEDFLESEKGQQFFDGLRISAQAFLIVASILLTTFGMWLVIIGSIDEIINGDLVSGLDTLGDVTFNIGFNIAAWFITLGQGRSLINNVIMLFGGASAIVVAIWNRLGSWRDILAAIEQGPLGGIFRWVRRIVEWILNLRGSTSSLAAAFGGVLSIVGSIGNAILTAIGYVRTLLAILPGASAGAARVGKPIGTAKYGQMGGIFSRPTNMIIGEAGAEALIPLTKPGRAINLLEQSGLADMIRGGDGSAAPTSIGTSGLPDSFMAEVPIDLGEGVSRVVQIKFRKQNRAQRRQVRAGAGVVR